MTEPAQKSFIWMAHVSSSDGEESHEWPCESEDAAWARLGKFLYKEEFGKKGTGNRAGWEKAIETHNKTEESELTFPNLDVKKMSVFKLRVPTNAHAEISSFSRYLKK